MFWVLLACVVGVVLSGPLYFSLPYRTVLESTLAQHIVRVEVNRYPYDIDFTLLSEPDHILDLQWVAQQKAIADRPDYRKNEDSVFGIVEFYGTQRADDRLEWKRRTAYNAYYYARDFLQKVTWMNLNAVKQLSEEEGGRGSAEGAFNFGPKNSGSQVLRNFRKYSKYMGDTVITFRGNLKDEDGEIIFGEFPTEIVKEGEVYSSNLEYLGEDFWIISTSALQLQRRSHPALELYRETVKVRLTLSERTVVIPQIAAEAWKKAIPKCTFQERQQNGKTGKYLSCKDLKTEDLSALVLNFTVRDSPAPLTIGLTDLELPGEGGTQWFAVRASETQQYQIGEAILREFAIGIDYRQGRLKYGPLAGESSISRSSLLKGFLVLNVVLFVVSAVLVGLEKRIRERMKVAVRQELGVAEEEERPSKANSYQLANVTEQSFTE